MPLQSLAVIESLFAHDRQHGRAAGVKEPAAALSGSCDPFRSAKLIGSVGLVALGYDHPTAGRLLGVSERSIDSYMADAKRRRIAANFHANTRGVVAWHWNHFDCCTRASLAIVRSLVAVGEEGPVNRLVALSGAHIKFARPELRAIALAAVGYSDQNASEALATSESSFRRDLAAAMDELAGAVGRCPHSVLLVSWFWWHLECCAGNPRADKKAQVS